MFGTSRSKRRMSSQRSSGQPSMGSPSTAAGKSGVGAPVLERPGAESSRPRGAPWRAARRRGSRGCPAEVDVVDLRRHGVIDRSRELPLPGGPPSRLPDRARARTGEREPAHAERAHAVRAAMGVGEPHRDGVDAGRDPLASRSGDHGTAADHAAEDGEEPSSATITRALPAHRRPATRTATRTRPVCSQTRRGRVTAGEPEHPAALSRRGGATAVHALPWTAAAGAGAVCAQAAEESRKPATRAVTAQKRLVRSRRVAGERRSMPLRLRPARGLTEHSSGFGSKRGVERQNRGLGAGRDATFV